MGLRSAQKSVTYNLGHEKVFEEAKNALSDCGFAIIKPDEGSGVITALGGPSFSSYGEDITVTVSKTAGGTKVNAHSRARAALFDWGKSGRNVNTFFAALNERLTVHKTVKSPLGYFE
jgi:hypothetical protein